MNKISTLFDFIEKYIYCIARTFNDDGNHLLYFTNGEDYTGPERDYFTWCSNFNSQFFCLLFGFDDTKDLLLKDKENLTFEAFSEGFVPGTACFFEIEDDDFHIFYFDEEHLYLVRYDDHGLKIIPVQKSDVLYSVKNPEFRSNFIYQLDESFNINISSIQLHKIDKIPSLCDLLEVIKRSHDLKSMIEVLKDDDCECFTDADIDNVVDVFNKHMKWLENYVSCVY